VSIDVVDLRNFYAQRLGVVARRFVGRGIRRRFADTRGMSVLGVGYPTPYLGLFREEAERCLAFMPAVQGVVKWPTDRPSLAAPFAGVHIVEATKQVYRAVPAHRERARLVPALEPALVASPGRWLPFESKPDAVTRPALKIRLRPRHRLACPDVARDAGGGGDARGNGPAGCRGRFGPTGDLDDAGAAAR